MRRIDTLAILKKEKPKKCVSEGTKYSLAKSRPFLFAKTSEARFNEERAMKFRLNEFESLKFRRE